MKTTLVALTIALGCMLIRPAAAQSQPPPAPAIVAQFLDFSDAQAVQFQQLLQEVQTATCTVGEQITIRQQLLEGLLNNNLPDPTAIGAVLVQIHALQQQLRQAVASYRGSVLALLTPDQLQTAQTVMQASQLAPAIQAFAAARLTDLP